MPCAPIRNREQGHGEHRATSDPDAGVNQMAKSFTAIVPPALKAASKSWQYSPAVWFGDHYLISGVVGVDTEGQLPPDFRGQAETIFMALQAILNEVGASLNDVASLTSYHVGDLQSQLREFVEVKAAWIRPPQPIWTAVGVAELAVPGALIEVTAAAVVRRP